MEAKNFVVLLTIALYFIVLADASHFRSAITRFTTDPNDPLRVTFDLEFAYRRSYPVANFREPGNPDGSKLPGDILTYQTWTFRPGQVTNSHFLISTANLQEDWIMGRFLVTHTYPSYLNGGSWWLAFMESCCRISTLRNARDTTYRVQMTFDLTPRTIAGQVRGNNSPVVGTNPLLRISNGEVFTYKILAHDPENDPLTYRLGTATECGAGHVQPSGLTVQANTGVITWDVRNVLLGLWTVCIRISDGFSDVPMDFLIEVRESVKVCGPFCELDGMVCQQPSDCGACSLDSTCVPNAHPVFVSPPTPVEGAEIDALVGQELVIPILAEDPNTNDVLSILQTVVPPGATMEAQQGTNPATRVFRWTPTAETSEVVCVAVQDQHGLGIVGGQQCFLIRVIDEIVRCEDPLGDADGFGVYAFEDITWASSHFEGRVVAGGDITLNGVHVGCNLHTGLAPLGGDGCSGATCADITAANEFEPTLVAGGDLTVTGSTRVITGSVAYGGSVSGTVNTASGCGVSQGTPVNTDQITQFFKDLSTLNSVTHPTGYYVQYNGGRTVFFASGNEEVDIFHLRADVILSATEIEVSGAHPNATIIFNVNGDGQYTFGGLGYKNVDAAKAVWNFYEATGVTFNAVDWRGTVLAPHATFTSSNGVVTGQVFVKSLSCSGTGCSRIRYTDSIKFSGCIPVRINPGPPIDLPEHPCGETWECFNVNSNSYCENGGCACIYGASGSYPNCTCQAPGQVVWVNGRNLCLQHPECTQNWQCNSGEVCEKEGSEPVGLCVFRCSADWQCAHLSEAGPASVARCNTVSQECECIDGASINANGKCACEPPKFFAWNNAAKMHCLAPNQCFHSWQCPSFSCDSDGTTPGACL